MTLDSTSSPSNIKIPDLTGIPEGTYTFTIKAFFDGDNTIKANYKFKIILTDPCANTEINIEAISDVSITIEASPVIIFLVAPDTVS